MKNYCKLLYKLKCTWSVVLIFCLLACFVLVKIIPSAEPFPLFFGGTVIGFAINAFFVREDHFVFMGAKDTGYLVQNKWLCPSVYKLANRETFCSLGNWQEILNFPESMIETIYKRIGRGQLDVKQAQLFRVKDQNSVFAVISVLSTRHGVPDPDTMRRIWGSSALPQEVGTYDLDQWDSGHNLVPVGHWPEKDKFSRAGD